MRVWLAADAPPDRVAEVTRLLGTLLKVTVPGGSPLAARVAGWGEVFDSANAKLEASRHDADRSRPAQAACSLPAVTPFELCLHLIAVGYTNPDAYPEQQGLVPGQARCLGCGRVFASDLDWCRAQDRALRGGDRGRTGTVA